MRHILRGCRHRKPASAKATYLHGDMATYLRPYFFLFILDMNIILGAGPIPRQNGGI